MQNLLTILLMFFRAHLERFSHNNNSADLSLNIQNHLISKQWDTATEKLSNVSGFPAEIVWKLPVFAGGLILTSTILPKGTNCPLMQTLNMPFTCEMLNRLGKTWVQKRHKINEWLQEVFNLKEVKHTFLEETLNGPLSAHFYSLLLFNRSNWCECGNISKNESH